MKLVIGKNGQRRVPVVKKEVEKLPPLGRSYEINTDGDLVSSTIEGQIIDFTGVKDINHYALAYAYYNNTAISGTADLSDLTELNGSYALCYCFYGCLGITGVDLSSLKRVNGQYTFDAVFKNCYNLTSINLSNLTDAGANYCMREMFSGCTGLTSVNLESLTVIRGNNTASNMFTNCTNLTNVNISGLVSVSGSNGCASMFYGCTGLTSVNIPHLAKLGTSNQLQYMLRNTSVTELRFPNLAYTTTNINSAFNNTLQGVTGCTVHFPSDWQTAMASYSNITNGLGGTNTTVLFDLAPVTTLDLSHLTSIKTRSLFVSFAPSNYFPNVTKIDLSSVTEIGDYQSCYSMFNGSTSITSIDLSSLETISGQEACYYMFSGCTGLTSVSLPALTTIKGYSPGMFAGCTGLTSVDLPALTTIEPNAGLSYLFFHCTGITSVAFPSLARIQGSLSWALDGCTSLSSVYFPALRTAPETNGLYGLLNGTSNVTIHFPSNLTGAHFDLSGTNTTILFDLPATNLLTGADTKVYSRNPRYDEAGVLAWKVGDYGTTDFTPFYTSGGAEPQVGDTIYSDSACTTAVTTISSIA